MWIQNDVHTDRFAEAWWRWIVFDLLDMNDFLSSPRRREETGQFSGGRSTGQLEGTVEESCWLSTSAADIQPPVALTSLFHSSCWLASLISALAPKAAQSPLTCLYQQPAQQPAPQPSKPHRAGGLWPLRVRAPPHCGNGHRLAVLQWREAIQDSTRNRTQSDLPLKGYMQGTNESFLPDAFRIDLLFWRSR